MLVAAKVLAGSALEVLGEPGLLEALRAEFAESRKGFHYSAPVGPEDRPALPSHMR